MRLFFSILLGTLLFSCSNTIDIQDLNGYWEIQEVTLANGTKKAYNFSNMVDFIAVKEDSSGIRKKMKPNLTGSYETSNIEEAFFIKQEGHDIKLYYKTPYSSWEETILELNKTQLKVVNQDGIVYTYKPYEPINID